MRNNPWERTRLACQRCVSELLMLNLLPSEACARGPQCAPRFWRWLYGTNLLLHLFFRRAIALALIVLASIFMFSPAAQRSEPKIRSPRAHEKIKATYDLKFGENPFAPGNTSTTGSFIPGEYFIASSRCAKCHAGAHAQWQESAHRNAFREPFYQKNVKDLSHNAALNTRGIANRVTTLRPYSLARSRKIPSSNARSMTMVFPASAVIPLKRSIGKASVVTRWAFRRCS